MNGEEVRRLAREKIIKELLGEDFRGDRPVETLGGMIGDLVEKYGIASYEDYRQKIGNIYALKLALEIINGAYREANGLDPKEEN